MKEMRSKGLCYTCDEKWNPSHVCKNPKLYLMKDIEVQQAENENEVFFDFMEGGRAKEEKLSEKYLGNLEISIHTISGSPSPNTVRIVGTVQQQVVIILVDRGVLTTFGIPLLQGRLSCSN
jgi:hypothetical protein